MTIRRQRRLLCLFHPWTQYCMQKKSPRLFQMHITVVIESHSQMHLVIFHYFIAEPLLGFAYKFFFLLIILTANAHTQPEEVEVIKIFHWKTRSKTKDWMNLHLTSKKRKAKKQKRLRKQQHERTEKAFLQSSKKEANAKRFASAQFKDVFLDLVAGCGSMCLWFSLVGAAR